MSDIWVTKSKVTDHIFCVSVKADCEFLAHSMNKKYQTDEYIIEEYEDGQSPWISVTF